MGMIEIQIGDSRRMVPRGTILRQLAEEYEEKNPDIQGKIVLAQVDGKLKELTKTVEHSGKIRFITTAERIGMRVYERSALMLLNKAIYDTVPLSKIRRVVSQFSVSGGLYVEIQGDVVLDDELIQKLTDRMREMAEADLPVQKTSLPVEDAIARFRKVKMEEKVKLFRYRRSSWVNLYVIDGFIDYHYGYMVPSTGYLKVFALEKYHDGLVLRMPDGKKIDQLADFIPREKLFEVMQGSTAWGETMGLATVGDVNDWISSGKTVDMVLIAEARQEARIAAIAKQIASRPEIKFVMIAGPSSSGKTSFSHRLSIQLRAHGLKPHPVAVDDYFVNREDTPLDENGDYDFEALECVDVAAFNKDMTDLLAGKTVSMPTFDFVNGHRNYKGNTLTIGKEDILVIEGIHCLNDKLSESLPSESKFRIYISALTVLNIDEHNRIPTTDSRLIRRILRDARTRGTSARETIARWPSVRKGEEKNIFPYQETADVMFDTSLIYEFPVMKPYAEQLLYGIPQDAPEYLEAKRMLKFFDYFLTIDQDAIPRNSLLKEFVGGSIFRV